MDRHLYAVERYGSQQSAAPATPLLPLAAPSRLVGVIELTDDDVRLALVEGTDPESVRASMTAAGWRVDRVTAAAWILPEAAGVDDGPATDIEPRTDGADR
jgi:hypothetical protein